VDGWHISQALKPFKSYLADPLTFEPDPRDISPSTRATNSQQQV
jgi:hypothetical protein